jgi:hypothetical protein
MSLSVLAPLLSGLTQGVVPARVFDVLLAVIPEVAEVIRGLMKERGAGKDKAKVTLDIAAEFIDERLDNLPEWKELSEERRDVMLYGLVEWIYWSIQLKEKHGSSERPLLKKAITRLRGRRR